MIAIFADDHMSQKPRSRDPTIQQPIGQSGDQRGCNQPASVEYLRPDTFAHFAADNPLCSNWARTARRCSLETRTRPRESVVTRTLSATTGEATASSAEVVDIIVMRTMTFMRNLARGAPSDAYLKIVHVGVQGWVISCRAFVSDARTWNRAHFSTTLLS